MRSRWIWAILAPLTWSAAVFADDIDDCNNTVDHVQAIRGCTALIVGGQLDRANAIRAFERRGSAYSETGNFDAAISDYSMAIEFDPAARLTYASRARVYSKKADYAAAIQDLTKSIAIKPNSFNFVERAQVYEKLGNHERAIADYTTAIGLDPDSAFGSQSYTERADVFMATGAYDAAVADYTKAIELDPQDVQLADRNKPTADLYSRRATAFLKAGKAADGLLDAERSLKLWPEEPTALYTSGLLLEALGRREEAIATLQRAVANAPDRQDVKQALVQLGVAPREPDEAYNLLKQIIELNHAYKRDEAIAAAKAYALAVERINGSKGPEYAFALGVLFDVYMARGLFEDAELVVRRTLEIHANTPVADRLEIARGLANLAVVLDARGKYAEAETEARRALEIREEALRVEHPRIAESVNNVAVLSFRQGRFSQAEALERKALQIIEHQPDALGKPGERLLSALNSLAAILEAEHRGAEAEAINRRALAVAEPIEHRRQKDIADGPPPPSVETSTLGKGSYFLGCGHNWGQLLISARQQTTGARDRSTDRDEFALSAVGEQIDSPLLRARVQSLYRMGANDPSIRNEGFVTSQRMLLNDAARAVAKLAVRFGSGTTALAAVMREQQDLLDRRNATYNLVHENFDFGQVSRIHEPEDELRRSLADDDKALDAIEAKLKSDFPGFIALAHPEPLSIPEVQAQLGSGEALVVFQDFDAWSNILAEETFIWVVTKTDSRWVRSDLGTKALTDRVALLRCGLDAANWTDASRWSSATEDAKARRDAQLARREQCKQSTGRDVASQGQLPFDLAKAHELYGSLFDQIDDLVSDKQLLIVPSGALTRLPFQVLVTNEPEVATPDRAVDYAKAQWLIRRHSITVLPSVASLKALRLDAKPSQATIPFIGFGNPLLLGPKENDERAFAKQTCQKTLSPPKPVNIASRGVPEAGTSFLRGGLGDVAILRRQSPLPETADELCTIAREVGAPDGDVHLGAGASETVVKTLNAEGTLNKARVVQFATHGLVAGETERVANALVEPALLLTPPTTPTEEDDGLLTASEVAQLKLDADWVVLSACNTAAGGGGKGAEALSGLARAFFYAGARALLVSHWYVDSRAAVLLTTGAFGELKRDPTIGRAEALRRSMLAAMTDVDRPKSWTPAAHPAVWAPFVVVGEGGASHPGAASTVSAVAPAQSPVAAAVAVETGSAGAVEVKPGQSKPEKKVSRRRKPAGEWDWLGGF